MVTRIAVVLLILLSLLPGLAMAVTDQEEVDLGKDITSSFEKKIKLSTDQKERAHLQSIVDKLAPGTGRDLPYKVQVVEIDEVNAITFPGGFIYVYRGLMDLHPNDDQLAGVLGHEMAHAVFSHGYKKLRELTLFKHIQDKLSHTRLASLAKAAELGNVLLTDGVGRRNEDQADYWGVKFAAKAGYDPRGLLQMLEVLAHLEHSNPGLLRHMLATHPPPQERILRVRAELRDMGVSAVRSEPGSLRRAS